MPGPQALVEGVPQTGDVAAVGRHDPTGVARHVAVVDDQRPGSQRRGPVHADGALTFAPRSNAVDLAAARAADGSSPRHGSAFVDWFERDERARRPRSDEDRVDVDRDSTVATTRGPAAPPSRRRPRIASTTPGSGNRTVDCRRRHRPTRPLAEHVWICRRLVAAPGGPAEDSRRRVGNRHGDDVTGSATVTRVGRRDRDDVDAPRRPPSLDERADEPAAVAANISTTAAAPVSRAIPRPTTHVRQKKPAPGASANGRARRAAGGVSGPDLMAPSPSPSPSPSPHDTAVQTVGGATAARHSATSARPAWTSPVPATRCARRRRRPRRRRRRRRRNVHVMRRRPGRGRSATHRRGSTRRGGSAGGGGWLRATRSRTRRRRR